MLKNNSWKTSLLVVVIVFGAVLVQGAESSNFEVITGNELISGAEGWATVNDSYSEDASTDGIGGYKSVSDYEGDSAMGAMTEDQPVAVVTINSSQGSLDYTKLASLLALEGSDTAYNVVSFNISNTTTKGTWEDVDAHGMSAAQSISTTNYDWTLSGSDTETTTVNVWVKNSLGVFSGRSSDTIVLDTSAPNAPGIPADVVSGTDSPDIDTAATASYYASYADASDSGSGLYGYEYALLEDDAAVVDWTATSITSNLKPEYIMLKDKTYKLAAKVIDNAGNESASVTSDGVAIGEPNVVLTKTVVNKGADGNGNSSGQVGAGGDILEYTIAFENNGTYAAGPVSVYDMIPANTRFSTASAQANLNGGSAGIYYVTDFDLTETGPEPSDKSTIKGVRFEISQVEVGVTGNVVFRTLLGGQ
ncbi:hypothetical protein ACFL4D_01245 [Candidatus Margulisiibacteriota bacterium]